MTMPYVQGIQSRDFSVDGPTIIQSTTTFGGEGVFLDFQSFSEVQDRSAFEDIDLGIGDSLAGMSAEERVSFVEAHCAAEIEEFHRQVILAAFKAVEQRDLSQLANTLSGWESTAEIYSNPELDKQLLEIRKIKEEGVIQWEDLEQELLGE